MLDLELDHGLRVLRGESGNLGFVEWAGCFQSLHGLVILSHLLHQRLQGWLLLLKDGLDLGVLIAGQVELLEHVVKFAARPAKSMRSLSHGGRHHQHHSGADDENADYVWISLELLFNLFGKLYSGPGGSPNI